MRSRSMFVATAIFFTVFVFVANLECAHCKPLGPPSLAPPGLQVLPEREGYIAVYIREGDTPLDLINPQLAEAFKSHEILHRKPTRGKTGKQYVAPNNSLELLATGFHYKSDGRIEGSTTVKHEIEATTAAATRPSHIQKVIKVNIIQ